MRTETIRESSIEFKRGLKGVGGKKVKERAQGRGSHIHSLLSSYVLCPPKGEAAVRLL